MAKYYFNYPFLKIKNRHAETCRFSLVGEDGFEPSKHDATDLQSAPFGHSGILPYSVVKMELADGFEPPTC